MNILTRVVWGQKWPVVLTWRWRPRVNIMRGGGAGGAATEGGSSASCLQSGHSGLWMNPANGLGSRFALGGLLTTGVALALRQCQRDKTTSQMRATPTTKINIGSHRKISTSMTVVYGLIIPCFGLC